MPITHAFTSAKSDPSDTTLVKPSDWNANHVGSGLIGVKAYNPSTVSQYNISSTSLTDVDATNLAVTFTAPASGNVLVRLSGAVNPSNSNVSGDSVHFGLRESTTNIAGPTSATRNPGGTSTPVNFVSITFYLTGISAGSHTYKWAFSVTAGTGSLRVGGTVPSDYGGQATMEVWDAT